MDVARRDSANYHGKVARDAEKSDTVRYWAKLLLTAEEALITNLPAATLSGGGFGTCALTSPLPPPK